MTLQITGVINTPINFYFTATAGITDFSGIQVYDNGILYNSPSITVVETTGTPGLYYSIFTPNSTGRYAISFQAEFLAQIDVVARDTTSYLKNIEDEALGSWVWDKQAGTLTMVRQNGTALANFVVVESLAIASREANNGQ